MLTIFRLFPKITVAAAVSILFQVNTAYSAMLLSSLDITSDDKVIYCSIGPVATDDRVRRALSEGTPVTFSWEITIEEVSDYWLNNTIGTIALVRQATPDLISKNWLLTDTSSGISQRVHTVDEAMLFLSRLDRFPTLDQSLLSPGVVYNFHIKLHIHEGEYSDSWWAELMRFSETVAQKTITLP